MRNLYCLIVNSLVIGSAVPGGLRLAGAMVDKN